MRDYNYLEKKLHNLVFKYKFINLSLFEIEKMLFKKNLDFENSSHIFITGLPRSGTTTILNLIYSSNQFASLIYRNMPFLMSPNISKLINKKNISSKQRAHKDGINFDLDSPEAFDEIFFRLIDKKNIDMKYEFKKFIELILISQNKKLYISKNNSNYKRINYINKIFCNSHFLISFRDPLQHAYSLYLQHLNFTELQKKDTFVKKYMDYLGHHEFGLNHKSWVNPKKYYDTFSLNYWIEQWTLFYNKIFTNYKNDPNCKLIPFEELKNKTYLINLIQTLKIKNVNYSIVKDIKSKDVDLIYDKDVLNEAYSIYNRLYSIKDF
ncbi:sulfotransferase [Candidatus Pelagibacter sp.]|nr:sulfotransferase [Candidatus Pelagibacter sp.]